MNCTLSKRKTQVHVKETLSHEMSVEWQDATDEQYCKAVAFVVRDMLVKGRREFHETAAKTGTKTICYLCMEFLLGRSFKNNLFNLGLEDSFRGALGGMNVNLDNLYEQEPDAGLGNGGLGRLAACFLGALATLGYSAMGYSLWYEYGISRQKLVEGWQTELLDFWLPGGNVWFQPVSDRVVEVHFDETIEESWNNQYHVVRHRDYTKVLAVPHNLYVAGMDGRGVSRLRVWAATSAEADFDMKLFDDGDYLRTMEQNAMAEVTTKVLYPEDSHPEGKSLRLTQQYFLVSATTQDIIRRHLSINRTLDNLPEKIAIHLDGTRPVLAIPEMTRVMLDEYGYGWDQAWSIIHRTMAYTNHIIMTEALESWGVDLFRRRLPRIYQIVEEINRRFCAEMHAKGVDGYKVGRMAPLNDGYVKTANLAVVSTHSINDVSQLHSDILKQTVFRDFYTEMPEKFRNVADGIAYRRWLNQSNPEYAALITELVGEEYIHNAARLDRLLKHQNDKTVLERMAKIRRDNKERIAACVWRNNGIEVDPDSIFDVQVKRLHEYEHQHLSALEILTTYQRLRNNPSADFTPRTYFFGVKAVPGYYMAKQIIQFIVDLGNTINNDPRINQKVEIVYLEGYRVTLAELLVPSADISEQISFAGTEASGTSNMEFMINGVVTLGTLNGANVEIHDSVGDESILLFGMTTPQVRERKRNEYYPAGVYQNHPVLRQAFDEMSHGFAGASLRQIADSLKNSDPYMVLADFDDYTRARRLSQQLYQNPEQQYRIALVNTAHVDCLSADRSIREYATEIWSAEPVPEAGKEPVEKAEQ